MADHPTKDELSGFVLGTLPPEATEAVAEHLEQCSPCQETAHRLDAHKDTLQQGLRRTPPPPVDESCRQAVEKVAAIASERKADPASKPLETTSATIASGSGITKEQFLKSLQASGLFSADELRDLTDSPLFAAASDGAVLARKLVEQNKLTKFQAQHLYQGKTRGFVFGEYVVLDRLGAGGMGQVYKARHRRMDRIVALKVISSASMKSADTVKRFQREVRAAAKLVHPNIVMAHDAGEQDGVHFLVMEYVEGQDLSIALKNAGPLPVRDVVDAVLQAARGLAFAHAEGVVHRDIKPANLLRDKKGVVKILDMGLARFDDPLGRAEDDGLTQSGQVMGTVDYMAPEQAFNTHDATTAADVYSLGCTLYRLLTGQPVFEGKTVVERIIAHRENPAPSLANTRHDVPAELAALFEEMVAKSQADRPAMSQVVVRLESLLPGLAPNPSAKPTAAKTEEPSLTEVLRVADNERKVKGSGTEQKSLTLARGKLLAAGAKSTSTPPATSAGGRKKPPKKLVVAAAAAGALAMVLGIWVVIKDKDGQTVGLHEVPADGSATIVQSPTPPSVATANVPPKPAATTDAPAAPFTDRTAAEWILSRKGSAYIAVDGQERTIANVASLPSGPFKLVGIRLSVYADIPISLDELRRLAPLKLAKLHLWRASLSDAHLAIIAENPDLREIDLFSNNAVTDAGIALLTKCPQLEFVALQRTKASNACLPELAKLKSIVRLNLTDQPVTDSGLAALAQLPNLETLLVDACFKLTGEFAAHLRENTQLKEIQLGRTPFTRKGLEAVASLPQLQSLLLNTANGNPMPAEWLSVFANHPSLTELNLVGDLVGDAAVPHLLAIPKLARLHIDNTGLTVTGITELRRAKPDLQIIGKPVATPPTTVAVSQPGDYALEFDGKSALVELPTLRIDSPAVTLEAWLIVSQQSPAAWTAVFAAGEPQSSIWFHNGTCGVDTVAAATGATVRYVQYPRAALGRRTHVACVWDGKDLYRFVDGQPQKANEVGERFARPAGVAPETMSLIGAFYRGGRPERYFDGVIDEVRVSKCARYAEPFAPQSKLTSDASTLALYHFDEGTGDVLKDSSDNKHHGKIVGAKWVRADGSPIPPQDSALNITSWSPVEWTEDAFSEWRKTATASESVTLENGVLHLIARNKHVFMLPNVQGRNIAIKTRVKVISGKPTLSARRNSKHFSTYYHGASYPDNLKGFGIGVGAVPTTVWKDLAVHRAQTVYTDWFEWVFVCRDDELQVLVNGQTIFRIRDASNNAAGGLAVGVDGEALFENLEYAILDDVKSSVTSPVASSRNPTAAPPPAIAPFGAANWSPLFNGKDLAGWKTAPDQTGDWRVENGVLRSSANETTHLFTERDNWTDFHLRCETRVNSGGNGGISCRTPFDVVGPDGPRSKLGYLVKINANNSVDPRKTGSLYVMQKNGYREGVTVATSPIKPDEWFTLDVIVEGNRVVIQVNGQTTTDYQDEQRLFTSGHIALQARQGSSQVEFRKIEIKELKPATLAASGSSSPPAAPLTGPPPAIAPFDAAQARAHQEAWAKHLGVPLEWTNSIGMKFVLIPPGEYLRGSDEADVDAALRELPTTDAELIATLRSEIPRHRVTLTTPCYCAVYELTQAQYLTVQGTNPSYYSSTGKGNAQVAGIDTSNYPVETMPWSDAAGFCNKLSVKENLTPAYVANGSHMTRGAGTGYRLPTDAEWEFVARAGTQSAYWSGNALKALLAVAWVKENSRGTTHPVGLLRANPFGLYDVHGNVFEWCYDGWEPNSFAEFKDTTARDPQGPSSAALPRVYRGGDWWYPGIFARSASRSGFRPPHRYGDRMGIRAVVSVEGVKSQLSNTANGLAGSASATSMPLAPSPAVAPFDAAQAKAHQVAWAKHLGTTVETTNSVGMRMVLIPPGEFMMGSTAEQVVQARKIAETVKLNPNSWGFLLLDAKAEEPQHSVRLSKPSRMSATEVTVGQFRKFVEATNYRTDVEEYDKRKNSKWDQTSFPITELSPVGEVSWADAVRYCNWLSLREGHEPCYIQNAAKQWDLQSSAHGYRLPTEAEWEFACRAGTTTQFSFGDDVAELGKYAWYVENSAGKTQPVAEKLPNALGLYDMHGNVYEWCHDWFSMDYYAVSPPADPFGPSTQARPAMVDGKSLGIGYRVSRGGNWNETAVQCRSASHHVANLNQSNGWGFRVMRVLDVATTVTPAARVDAVKPSVDDTSPPRVAPVASATGTVPTPPPAGTGAAPGSTLATKPVVDPNDPIAKKLATAKGAYDREMQQIKKTVLDALDRREALARRQADKAAVDAVKADRDAYEKSGTLPVAQWSTLDPKLDAAKKTLLAAYETAIREYTRGGKDAAADAVQKEMEAFQKAVGVIAKIASGAGKKLSAKELLQLNREVAAWAVGLKARVVLLAPTGETAEVQNGQIPTVPFAVKELHMNALPVTDADLDKVTLLSALTHLDLRGTEVTEEGILKLGSLANLKSLNLHARPLADRGVAVIGGLKNLEFLDIAWAKITDAGLDAVADLPELKTINLFAATVTDDGLRKLARLKNLTFLELKNPKISPATIQYLETSLPGLRISR